MSNLEFNFDAQRAREREKEASAGAAGVDPKDARGPAPEAAPDAIPDAIPAATPAAAPDASPDEGPRVWGVRELNLAVSDSLRDTFGSVRVSGEISGWKRYGSSGHCYFALKEERAELRCVMWRTAAAHLSFDPADGLQVNATGRLTIYPERGAYQLVVEQMNPAGQGALQQAFEALKRRLQAEGLFDEERRRALPAFPRTVGVITSGSGAAVADVMRVLRSRWPGVEIVLSPVRVQGEGASAEIAAAIEAQNRHGVADLLIVGRGGGSLEDLWAFNEELTVRAVSASRIPVISAVGHETDVTLCDFAADLRAATPSRAAELAVPEAAVVRRSVSELGQRVAGAAVRGLVERRRRIRALARGRGLDRPRMVLENAFQRADDLRERLSGAPPALWEVRRRHLDQLRSRIAAGTGGRARTSRAELDRLRGLLAARGPESIARRRTPLAGLAGKLEALSPLDVLSRGYALCGDSDGRLVRDGAALEPGDRLELRFHRGGARGVVETSWSGTDESPDPLEDA